MIHTILNLKTWLLMMCLLAGVGNAWAEDADYTLTPSRGSNQAYDSNCDVTIDGITWNITGNSQMDPWRIGGKQISKIDREVYSKTAYSSAVSKIDLTVGAASNITVHSLKLVYSTNSNFSNSSEISKSFIANSTISFEADFPANAYYKFVFNVTVTDKNNNKFVEFSKVEFYNKTVGPIPSHTAKFSINGIIDEAANCEAKEGAAITFPTAPADMFGKKFVGWTKVQDYTHATTAPADLCEAEKMGTEDVVYYAVYAKQKGEIKNFSFTLRPSDFSGASYAANDSKHTVTAIATDGSGETYDVEYTTKSVMLYASLIQFKSSEGYLYNNTKLGKIISVEIQSPQNLNTCYASSENPTSGTLNTNQDYFSIRAGSGTGTAYEITVIFKKSDVTTSCYCTSFTFTHGTLTLAAKDTDNAYWATFSNEKDVFIDADKVTAHVVTVENSRLKINGNAFVSQEIEIPEDVTFKGIWIPANTGVLIKSPNATQVALYTVDNVDAEPTSADNMLRASSVAMEASGYKFYKLAYKSGTGQDPSTLGFYYGATNGAAYTCSAGKSYLAVPLTAGAPQALIISDEEVSGIQDAQVKETANHNIYNIVGQRISSLAAFKGIVIKNGKKMFNK